MLKIHTLNFTHIGQEIWNVRVQIHSLQNTGLQPAVRQVVLRGSQPHKQTMYLIIKITQLFRRIGILLIVTFPPAAREPVHNKGGGPFVIKRLDANIAGVLS